jgi:hypothetical protein
MKSLRLVLASFVVLIVFGIGLGWHERGRRHATIMLDERAPEGARVRVEVINSTKTRGLARRATMFLRDRGFDVVGLGTTADPHDTTVVIDASGHPDWANRVARAFAPARVDARPDTSRYLDIVVVVGSTWRPPAQPLDP